MYPQTPQSHQMESSKERYRILAVFLHDQLSLPFNGFVDRYPGFIAVLAVDHEVTVLYFREAPNSELRSKLPSGVVRELFVSTSRDSTPRTTSHPWGHPRFGAFPAS